MKIAVWRTGHEIADRVALEAAIGIGNCGEHFTHDRNWSSYIEKYDIHIGYGILRGMDDVFKACQAAGKPFIHIDKGYWKPGHFDGYYRVSLNDTQQTTGLDQLEPDYARWDALGIDIDKEPLPYYRDVDLVCPPTDHVQHFFMPGMDDWINCDGYIKGSVVRRKGEAKPIDWRAIRLVNTFNSSVGWEALRQGIPVVADPTHSMVGAYQKLMDKPLHMDYDQRRRLFAVMASLQLTLEEMKSGKLWSLIQRLLNATSAGIPEKL